MNALRKVSSCFLFGGCTLLLLPIASAGAEFVIQSLDQVGRLRFNELSNAQSYRVEWAASPTGAWHTNWSELIAVAPTGTGNVTVLVPMCYRVLAVTTGSTAGVVIQSIEPNFGTVAGGTTVTVSGSNFSGATQANWGGTTVPVTVAGNGNSFSLITPPHPTGTVSLSVTNGAGQSAAVAEAFSYVVVLPAGRVISVDGQGGDWTSDCLVAEELTPSNWTANNSLQKLYAAYNTQYLYLAIEGAVENNNALTIYLDSDFGAGSGVANMATLSDNSGNLDNALSSALNASGVGGFGAELGIGMVGMRSVTTSSNYPATDYAGMRYLAPPTNFGWATGGGGNSLITLVAKSGTGALIEMAIPWTAVYTSGFPQSGARLGLFARIGSSDGTFHSNQCLPGGDELIPQTVQHVAIVQIR